MSDTFSYDTTPESLAAAYNIPVAQAAQLLGGGKTAPGVKRLPDDAGTPGPAAGVPNLQSLGLSPQDLLALQAMKLGVPAGFGGYQQLPQSMDRPGGYYQSPAIAQAQMQDFMQTPAGTDPTKTAAKPAAKPAAPAAQPPQDALTMGLGMFFQQYLAPLMQQQSQANSALIGQYGQSMNQALGHALPPGVAGILQATTPQTQGLLQMMNQAGVQQAAGMGPYEQFMNQIGGQTSAYQALTDIITKAAGNVALYGGGMGSYGPLLQQLMPKGSLGAAAAQASSTAGATPNMLGLTGVSGLPTSQQPVPTAPTTAPKS